MKRILALLLSAVIIAAGCAAVNAAAYEDVNAALSSGEAPDEPAETAAVEVPKIEVKTKDGNGTELQKADGYVDASITITDTDGTVLSGDISFKVRGNTTAMTTVKKKAFTFKFGKKTEVLGLGKGKKWALIANAFDPTLLRNLLVFNTANELEIPYTSSCKVVELWLDDSFRGCYVLFEPVQVASDRVDIDVKGNDGKKDFLIEYEAIREEEDVTYFKISGLRFISSEPEEPTEEQLAYITDTMTDIINTLKTGDEAKIGEKIDMSSFVKFYLMNEYFKTFDFNMSSVYFYYKDGKLYAGPPWDYDLSMGNSYAELSERCKQANSSQGMYADKNLYIYLAKKDWFKELVREEYIAHYDYFSSLHTDGGVLDTLRATYRDQIDRNYTDAGWNVAKWWINIQRKPDKTYDENYAFVKNWLAERHEWFDEYLEPFEREYITGDADCDGAVTVPDATAIQKYLVGLSCDAFDEIAADVDSNGLDVTDATKVQRYLVGFDDGYGIGEKATQRMSKLG